MAFGGLDNQPQAPMADINTTPLVDVMLVLLIIFIITAPLMTKAIKVNLPKANAESLVPQPDAINLSIDAQGQLFWNQEQVDDVQAVDRMKAAALPSDKPTIHITADQQLTYQRLAEVLAMLKEAGLSKVGFVTSPNPHVLPKP